MTTPKPPSSRKRRRRNFPTRIVATVRFVPQDDASFVAAWAPVLVRVRAQIALKAK